MKRVANPVHRFESLTDLHNILGVEKPMHPLISLVNTTNKKASVQNMPKSFILNFYKITFEPNLTGKSKVKYGQKYYDFNEGGMFFLSPNQVVTSIENDTDHSGFALFIHPDFFLGYPLASKIKKYNYFSYSINEALHVSDAEKEIIVSIFKIIEIELNSRIDDLSQDVIISQIELLLNYCNRFYKRQFITRKASSGDLLQKLEEILDDYFNTEKSLVQGMLTVQYLAEQLNTSPGYLSDMLRNLTGQNAQQHIHNKLIDKAKELLSNTNLTVAEIAYQLGFEQSQSLNRIFKKKLKISPLKFRASFN